jgi:arabinogalactan endo-1,4-beta-galactosidase
MGSRSIADLEARLFGRKRQSSRFAVMMYRTLLLSAAVIVVCARPASAAPFMSGADISALTVLENRGAVYRDGGQVLPAIDILRDHGVNWFRLRLFVNPNMAGDPFVANNLAYTIDLAERAKASGAKLLLDFHYSDTWADPGRQTKPAAWSSLDYNELQQQVYSYTKSSIEAFKAEGVLPEMVQIGNEISNGMLWNPSPNLAGANSGYPWTGGSHSTGFNRLAGLLQAGIDGAKDGAGIGQEPLVMIHHDKGAQWNTTSFFFDRLVERNVEFDVIGYSYYPKFHYDSESGAGSIADVALNLNNTVSRFGKPVVVVETGFASRGAQFEPDYEFEVSPEGQRQFLEALVDVVQDVPRDLGWGVFCWYPEARPVSGLNVWESGRYGLFDQGGNLLPAASVFEQFIPPTLGGDYNGDGQVDAADFVVWRANDGTPAGYDTWRTKFGATLDETVQPTASSGLVPEATALPMILAGFLAMSYCRRRAASAG